MTNLTLTPPPAKTENKVLSMWLNSVYSALKKIDARLDLLEARINSLEKGREK